MSERTDALTGSATGREVESLFARDDDDHLVRRERETRARFREMVTVVIDGFPIEVPRAVPKTDAQGNPVRDTGGELVPRTTTIYDAAVALVNAHVWSESDLKHRIPVLCHQAHLSPVGMCRMCSVHISSVKRGKLTPGRRLVPSCQHRVERGMVVTTRAGLDGYNPATWKAADVEAVERFAAEVNSSIRVVAELLAADHLLPDSGTVKRYESELTRVARVAGVTAPRAWFARPAEAESRNRLHEADPRSRRIPLPLAPTPAAPEELEDRGACRAWEDWNRTVDERFPYSSRSVVVDHDKCILCDRCVRSCNEVKPFQVLGHTGKGYETRISFDLDSVMGDSSCVQCAECMVSCPTGALSLRRRVQPRAWPDSPTAIPQNPNTPFPTESGFLTADEMRDVWLAYHSPKHGPRVVFPFRSIPYAYLKWNEGAVRKREVVAGEKLVLYREGEYGSTAFLLQGTGLFHFYVGGSRSGDRPSFFGRLFGRKPSGGEGEFGRHVATRPGNQLVMGEMGCLTHQRRESTVVFEADPRVPALELVSAGSGWPVARVAAGGPPRAVVYEVTRNMLDMMQRTASFREHLDEVYTKRAVESSVRYGELCADLPAETREELAAFLLAGGRLEFRRVPAGQTIVAEGEPARDYYIIRLGTVRLFRTVSGRERVLSMRSRGQSFGAIGLLADDLRRWGALPRTSRNERVATVAALDPVEVVRVPGDVFHEMCRRFPAVHQALLEDAARRLSETAAGGPAGVLSEYARQGLFQGQKLLALDLNSCTRCDECTKACADSHDGHSRLLREGLRFGDFLVATSCRSCHKPYCMDGCPVDAIHRREGKLGVVIEDHCIGCGLCEKNCPYGSIQMVPRDPARSLPLLGEVPPLVASVGPRRAVNCDLCEGETPACVSACPHFAAFRIDGPALLDEVLARKQRAECV
ncbi:MAG: cyclic nucleotide-binding domain-containing protein [Planctomycetes bacterium]|nr:cyclic nucleotide-binding domain-containing protein [Planctomycetota bacterium]